MRTILFAALFVLTGAGLCGAEEKAAASAADKELGGQISRLVGRLNDDRAVERDAAEKKLIELAGSSAAEIDRFLEHLPKENDEMPLAVRDSLARIRQQVENRVAKAATAKSSVTIAAKSMPLADVFKAIESQTGNRLVLSDEIQADDPKAAKPTITIDLKDESFWPAVDQVLDQAKLSVYSYGGEDALSIVPRGAGDGPRFGQASYNGPFRIEAMEVQTQRNLRQPKQKSLKLQLQIGWEPRLRPIVVSQPAAELKATTDTGKQLAVGQTDAVLDVEVPHGTQAAELVLPFELPPREAKSITTLKGKLKALVPGQLVKFEFKDVAKAAGQSQKRGGVSVTVDAVRKNNAIWEVHMRFALDEAKGALQSHRDWMFQNVSYLVGKDGKSIDNAGFETTSQSEKEVGVAYLFDLPDGPDGLTWVYETPAAIVEMPIEYELKDIELP